MGQFLNCIYDSSRIVFLTIQELSKAQCNNTDNNYTDYSDSDPILSFQEWIKNGADKKFIFSTIIDISNEIISKSYKTILKKRHNLTII